METEYALELDVRGLVCPLPLIKTKKAIEQINSGEVLKIIATDPNTVNDIPAWVKNSGHRLIKLDQEEGQFKFYVKKES